MIKCPNCGSTAQVRLVAYDDLSNSFKRYTKLSSKR